MNFQNWADLLANPEVFLEVTHDEYVTFDELGIIFESYDISRWGKGEKSEDLVNWSDYH